jgi:hypothetical protein
MLLKDISDHFPFISVLTYGGNEYVGIVSNQDNYVTCLYCYSLLKGDEDKKNFLQLGNVWWWESNRMIPINIFLRNEMDIYRYSLMSMNTKDVRIVSGPTVNLGNLAVKRVKRKSVQLVRKVK